jgi:hypothetical protein
MNRVCGPQKQDRSLQFGSIFTLMLKTKDKLKMKKILLSLAVAAALSSAAMASSRNYDLRGSDTYFGKFSETHAGSQLPSGNSTTEAFKAVDDSASLTAFERMMKISEENEHGRHN